MEQAITKESVFIRDVPILANAMSHSQALTNIYKPIQYSSLVWTNVFLNFSN